jgi:hypothetical protein
MHPLELKNADKPHLGTYSEKNWAGFLLTIVFAPFFVIIKTPNEVWSLIVFAPFLLIIIIIPLLLLAVNLFDQILRD